MRLPHVTPLEMGIKEVCTQHPRYLLGRNWLFTEITWHIFTNEKWLYTRLEHLNIYPDISRLSSLYPFISHHISTIPPFLFEKNFLVKFLQCAQPPALASNSLDASLRHCQTWIGAVLAVGWGKFRNFGNRKLGPRKNEPCSKACHESWNVG